MVVYARNLVQEEQAKKVTAMPEKLFEYHVYERMSAGIGASVYDDRNFDTVYFNEELAHDFASWVSGDSMEPKYQSFDHHKLKHQSQPTCVHRHDTRRVFLA